MINCLRAVMQYNTELPDGGNLLGRVDYGWMDEYYLSEALSGGRYTGRVNRPREVGATLELFFE